MLNREHAGLKPSFSNRIAQPSSSADFLHQSTLSASARVTEVEKTVRALEEENRTLREELANLGALYKQLLTEGKHESFDERRILLLKSQVIQLERQVILLTRALGARSSTCVEVENAVAAVLDSCRSFLHQKNGGREARVSYADINRIITTLESARAQLFRTMEVTTEEGVNHRLTMIGDFVRNRPSSRSATLLDVCRGGVDHINLKRVGQLESKLVKLYKQLMLVDNALRLCIQSSAAASCLPDAPRAVYSRLVSHVTKSCDMLEDTCSDLLQLSLLVPTAPLPALTKPFLGEFTVEDVLGSLRGTTKTHEMRPLVEAMLKAMNYSIHVAGCERNLLLNELEFHRAVYEQQSSYVNSLLAVFSAENDQFRSDVRENLCLPLTSVVESFKLLKEELSQEALVHFVEVFDKNATTLANPIEQMAKCVDSSEQTLQLFAEHKKMVHRTLEACQNKRDQVVDEVNLVKSQLRDQTADLMEEVERLRARHQSSGVDSVLKRLPNADRLMTSMPSVSSVEGIEEVNRRHRRNNSHTKENHTRQDTKPPPAASGTPEACDERGNVQRRRRSLNMHGHSRDKSTGSGRETAPPGVAQRKLMLKDISQSTGGGEPVKSNQKRTKPVTSK